MAAQKILLLLVVLPIIRAFILDTFVGQPSKKWDGLKVTWGADPLHIVGSYDFADMPRTEAAAKRGGWVKFDSHGCSGNPKFAGVRYWKDRDMAVILLYDTNGFIAGIQAGFPNAANRNNYPAVNLQNKPFVLDNNNYFITAYFTDPATICSTGRTQAQYDSEGTGKKLFIQNGTDPVRDKVQAPPHQADVGKTLWTKGACFYTMGMHYWYNIREDMDCDDYFPVFLLYNGGELNAFGWAFGLNIQTSHRLEHPPKSSYGHFMTTVPRCLANWGTLTTLHIYMTDSPVKDLC